MEGQPQSFSPWLSIWIKPRDTIRKIVETNPTKYVLLLAMLEGLYVALNRASSRNSGDTLSFGVVLALCVIFGPIGGITYLYMSSALLRWTGSWLGGHATSEQVRAAVAWSYVPVIFILPLWIPELLIFGEELFTNSTPKMDGSLLLLFLYLGFTAIELIAGIWTLIVFLRCLGEVHQFSAWKALSASILGILVVVIPIVVLAVAFENLSRAVR